MTPTDIKIITTIERTYAAALYDLAEQADVVTEVLDELMQLVKLTDEQPDLMRLISTQTLSAKQRETVLEQLFHGRISDLLYRFIQVVNHKGRLGSFKNIARAFDLLVAEKRGIVEVDAHVAQRFDQTVATNIAEGIAKAIGRQVVLHQHVNPQLIGGLKLRVGDRQIDGSVATQLRLMRNKIIAAGREDSRARLEQLIK